MSEGQGEGSGQQPPVWPRYKCLRKQVAGRGWMRGSPPGQEAVALCSGGQPWPGHTPKEERELQGQGAAGRSTDSGFYLLSSFIHNSTELPV